MIKKTIRSLVRRAAGCRLCQPSSPQEKTPYPPQLQSLAQKLGEQQGFTASLAVNRPVAADGRPIPWYTYPAIEYFNQWDVRGLNIFEYSSGNSSLYWADRGANVYSIEHDPEWFQHVSQQSCKLQDFVLASDKESYSQSIRQYNIEFDIIIIDGVWRNECACEALRHSANKPFIILDNSDWYTDVAGFVRGHGYFQIDWNGFGPLNPYAWTTTLFIPFKSVYTPRIGMPNPIGGIRVGKNKDLW